MAIESIASVKAHFETGDRPTQVEFENLIDTLGRATPLAIASAAEGGKAGLYEILGDGDVTARALGSFGRDFIVTSTAASARTLLGFSSVASIFIEQETTASAQTALGITSLGQQLITATATASAVSALGLVTVLGGFINGLTLSNGTDSDHDIDVAAGIATDDADAVYLSLSSAITKQIDATWAVGTGNGGLDTGTVAADTWYAVWLIRRSDTGVVDVLFSTSFSSPTLPTDYDQKRRIGAVLTNGSSNIVAFVQMGDDFWWDAPVEDFNGNHTATAQTLTTTVPTGIQVIGRYTVRHSASPSSAVLLSSLLVADTAPAPDGPFTSSGGSAGGARSFGGYAEVLTNTSGQIRHRGTASLSGNIHTYGWIDSRGRDA